MPFKVNLNAHRLSMSALFTDACSSGVFTATAEQMKTHGIRKLHRVCVCVCVCVLCVCVCVCEEGSVFRLWKVGSGSHTALLK